MRRVGDSNPRTCNSQQFSRLPQSTTLPTLRCKSTKGNHFDKYYFKINTLFIQFSDNYLNIRILILQKLNVKFLWVAEYAEIGGFVFQKVENFKIG
jgi:NAD+--asparagine ADP-ribosyltransferase